MGNQAPRYSSAIDQQTTSDFVDDNVWFMIKISGKASCDKNEPFSGFLRFPRDAEKATVDSGVAFYDPNSAQTIKNVYESIAAGKDLFLSGYLWKVKKINDKYFLIGKNPQGGNQQLQSVEWTYSAFVSGEGDWAAYSALHAGFPSGGTIRNSYLDVEKSISNRQLWFLFDDPTTVRSQILDGHTRTRNDWGSLGLNKAYGRARFCDSVTDNKVEIYPVDLSTKQISTTPISDFSIFARPEGYINWYFSNQVSKYWTQATIRAPGNLENLIQSWIKSLTPQARSDILYRQTKRCDYSNGRDFWGDELCRYGCNGDGTPNNITLNGCPEIGQKIVSSRIPNDWLRSELGRAYCKENPGFCEQVLNSWCQTDTPDPDSKFSDQPFGKKNMCACSWPMEIQKKKIMAGMPSIQALMTSDNLYTRQVGERIIQSQLAYFVCKDPDCVQSAIYKNKDDKNRVCPVEQIQNCITEIKVDAGGNIDIAKDIASNVNCQQFFGDVVGKEQLECLKKGGKIYDSGSGKTVCCLSGEVFDGKVCKTKDPTPDPKPDPKPDPNPDPKPDPKPQPKNCPLGKILVNGECKCPFGEDSSGNCLAKCDGQRMKNGGCCPTGKDVVNDKCVDPCLKGQIRDQTGNCIIVNPSPDPPKPNPLPNYTSYIMYAVLALVFVSVLALSTRG